MAAKVFRWIDSHRYSLWGLYGIVFLAGFFALEIVSPKPRFIIHCPVDDMIPFCKWFVIPYCIWYLWVPGFMLWFLLTDKKDYLRFCFVFFSGATICLVVYFLWPNGLTLRREIGEDDILCRVISFIRSIDPPVNVCPSIHVHSTVTVHVCVMCSDRLKKKMPVKAGSLLITLAICLATVFVKQHSAVDVVCGAALTGIMFLIWEKLVKNCFQL